MVKNVQSIAFRYLNTPEPDPLKDNRICNKIHNKMALAPLTLLDLIANGAL